MPLLKRLTLALAALLFLAAGQIPVQAADPQPTPAAEQATAAVAQAPQTNAEIRQWYNDQIATIPALDAGWRRQGLGTEDRARLAQEIRHAARLKARDFMKDKQEVAALQARDMEKYGNPDGPTFEQLVESNRKAGLEGDAVYEAIISSANRTNRAYNDKFGVKQPGQSP